MQRLIWAVLLAFAIALAIGPLFIPWLKRLKFGQTIYELAPETHKVKQGTPTMGGFIFAVPLAIASLLLSFGDTRFDFLLIALATTLGFGAIGFLDDYIKVVKKRSLGLTPKQKLAPQILLALAVSYWAFRHPLVGPVWYVPFAGASLDLGWLYIPIMTFVIVGTVNSANLLDGLDGLLTSSGIAAFATFGLICLFLATGVTFFAVPKDAAYAENALNLMVFCGAAAGGLLGFFRFNSYPARVIMGDIGSFTLGGALVAVAMLTRLSLLLPLIALMMMLSSASDLIQFAYFRATKGKRIFRMAPLHHHFEKGGVSETKIVSVYTVITVLMCLVALLGLGM